MSSTPERAFLGAVFFAFALGRPCVGAPSIVSDAAELGAGLPVVQYDLESCYVPALDQAFYVTTSPTFELPLVLSEPTGGFGQVSWMAYGMTSYMGTVSFSGSQTTATYSLTFGDAPPYQFYPGWFAKRGLTYFVLPEGLEVGTIFVVTPVLVQNFSPGGAGDECWWLFNCYLWWYTGWGKPGICEPGTRGVDPYTALTRYRDEVLAATPTGQYYIDLYNQYSSDMILATVAEPDLLVRTYKAQDAWVAALQALVDGDGDAAVVTQQMQDDLNGILDSFAAHGGAALADVVTLQRQRLQLDSIAGLTVSEFQQQVETLGGPSAVEPQSWGRIKSLYR
jgi:hypothetical protein